MINKDLIKKYPNLKRISGDRRSDQGMRWKLDNILDGYRYFYDLNGRLPTVPEIDNFEYLSSARSIERTHGGVINVRKRLNIQSVTDYTRGKARSSVAKKAYKRAEIYEERFYNFLISKIPEQRVHEQKRIRPGNISSDFFIYTDKSDGVVIDLFYARDMKTLQGVVLIKEKRYRDVPYKTLFICVNSDIKQNDINKLIKNKKNKLSKNIKVLTEAFFIKYIDKFI